MLGINEIEEEDNQAPFVSKNIAELEVLTIEECFTRAGGFGRF